MDPPDKDPDPSILKLPGYPILPQTGVPGVRHSTFASLRLGRSSQSIASNLLASWIP
ncbi:hypothetical protein YC2023_075673 [Brassica napus]